MGNREAFGSPLRPSFLRIRAGAVSSRITAKAAGAEKPR
jgi:hypothetical protein